MNFPKYFAIFAMLVLCLISIQVAEASLWSDIKSKADAVGDDVKSDVASGINDVKNKAAAVSNDVKSDVASGVNDLKNKADQVGDDIKSDAIIAGKDALKGAGDVISVVSAGHIIYSVGKAAVDSLV